MSSSPGAIDSPDAPDPEWTPATSPSEDIKEVQAMDEDTRLQRIKYLVDQSKLYAQFLASSIEETAKAEDAKEVKQQEPPKKKVRVGTQRKAASKQKQTTLKSFIAPKKAMEQSQDDITPKSLTVSLYDYQKVGVRWMVNLYENGLNGILADEMGLGKTLETIAFLAYLLEHGVNGPFLVVGPLSTTGNWAKEFAKFAPSISVCSYYGVKDERAKLRRRFLPASKPKASVFVTSYEIVMADAAYLNKIDWKYIIVDEGHRLKNIDCKLMRELKLYSSANRLLLTGTPLQNNLAELWSLLHFLLPDVFADLGIFHSWFEQGGGEAIEGQESDHLVTSLHSILRPFLLRRLKSEVNLHLPSKREYVIYTGLTELQTELYQSILSGEAREYVVQKILEERDSPLSVSDVLKTKSSPDTSSSSVRSSRRSTSVPWTESDASSDESPEVTEDDLITDKMIKAARRELASKSFSNMVMQLRLACDSPYLFWYPWMSEGDKIDKRIESTSGKLIVLQSLVSRLKRANHRVLVFSQFTKMLDLLEDWCALRKYTYLRLDGGTSQADRESIMGDFNANNSKIDLFLLSTRSGGQGVNLTAADTVVIFDSDFNPQQDLQAMDRVHRIGQDKPVLVFRLIAGDTVEQDLLDRASAKLELTNLVIEKGHFKGVFGGSGSEQQETIKSMGRQLQQHRERFAGSSHITPQDLKALLDRSPQAYKNAQENPKLTEDIYCRNVEL